ncbi:SPRY domain-containing protein [Beauveria brongniartii RCEF 3172]|uniref:SPRY domain-containing protein n=1 Tax=Beauveria brongniartii RCEF 3172 TaxID=1081107 RepID=A0A167CG33_9HYPO|nr:SPRY domain-containing protein [Beauveria brongniartii RCEF 3172]
MCFGGKNERSDDPPPRPAQNYQSQSNNKTDFNSSSKDHKMSSSTSNSPYSNGPSHGQFNNAGVGGSAPSNYGASGQEQYAPPPGPPPSHIQRPQEDFAPPPGPPPSHRPSQQVQDEYAPPPGPPPGKSRDNTAWIAPPQDGPSQPSQKQQHDWEAAVPDTSLFPPPPAIFSGYDASPANNSTEAEAEAGEAWCAQYPLTQPIQLDAAGADALRSSNFRLIEPAGFRGRLTWQGAGAWAVSTPHDARDATLISYPPLYVVSEHDPTRTGRSRSVYYEVKISRSSPSANVALGYTALPYPGFRLPGWHRASLAVHGDDGHKYINDRWGGKDFTAAFNRGDTYGIGLRIGPSREAAHKASVHIFLTRNGVEAGGWDLHEETDAEQDLPVTGLEGFHDLCASVGVFEGTEFEVVFDPARWMYRGIGKE